MDVVGRAPQLVAALFDDGGSAVLRDAQLGESWEAALAHVPPEILAVPAGEAGLAQLTAVRDFFARRDDLRPAIVLTRALLELHARRRGPDHPDAMTELGALGALAQRAGRVEEGARLLERAYQGLRQRAGNDLRVAVVGANLALHHARHGRWQEAEPLLEAAYRIRGRLAPDTTPQVAAQLGEVRVRLGREAQAAPLYEEAWRKLRRALGPAHPRVVARARAYGRLLNQLGQHALAVAPLREAVDALRDDGEGAALAGFELGVALDAIGRKEEGLRHVEEAVRWTRDARRASAAPHPSLPERLTKYAAIQLQRGRPAEAEGLLREALEAETLLYGDASPEVAARYAAIGYFHARAGRAAEALGWLDPAASLMRSAAGDDDPRTRVIVDYQVALLLGQAQAAADGRDRALAAQMLRRAWQLAVPVLGHGHRKVLEVRALADRLGIPL